jgi:hypothetical protein
MLSQARELLVAADVAEDTHDRFRHSLAAARYSAVGVLSGRGADPLCGGDVWRRLPLVAPELAEWAAFFAAAAAKQRAADQGVCQLSAREADDLFRDAQTFHVDVVRRLRRQEVRRRGVG